MTLLTGIELAHLQNARPLDQVMQDLTQLLGAHVTVVGHGLKSDIAWLGLRAGIDYLDTKDTAKLFAVKTTDQGTLTPSLRHLSLAMFGVDMQEGIHSPEVDALYAMKLYQMHANATPEQINQAKQVILNVPRPSSIARRYPYIDGCELSSRSMKYAAELELIHPSTILFLDLDGVLNRTRAAAEIHVESELVGHLMQLVAAPRPDGKKIGIVVSSFWRCFAEYIGYILERQGLPKGTICGVTSLKGKNALTMTAVELKQEMSDGSASSSSSSSRGSSNSSSGGGAWGTAERKGNDTMEHKRCDEIAEYLYEHPEITRYCIVDDRETASNTELDPHFVLTTSTEGLTLEKVQEVEKALQVARF